ncbi:MAG: hypothetical protein J5661_03790 [Bacteroidaceae bacterium]|nr:hypothetical protein [Bacteroidaceae bacterium]
MTALTSSPLTALMGFMVLAAMGLNRRPMPLLMSASASRCQPQPDSPKC